MTRRTVLLLALFLAAGATATTLHVPGDVPTIQAALDSISDQDTIKVALGTYAEALQAPPLHFVLRGDVTPDTGEYPRPIIDPSPLANSQFLGCLTLPLGSWPVLEDLEFRNGPEMYPHQDTIAGGLYIRSYDFTMRRCIMDSTFRTLQFAPPGWDTLHIVDSLIDCTFRNMQVVGVRQLDFTVVAINCSFESSNAFQFALGARGSHFDSCRFGVNTGGGFLVLDGHDTEVSNCMFGPSSVGSPYIMVLSQATQGILLQNNVFTDLVLAHDGVKLFGTGVNCFRIQGNVFDHITVDSTNPCLRLTSGSTYQEGWGGAILDNTFTDCFAQGGANAIYSTEDVNITGNRFTETVPDPHFLPTVLTTRSNHAVLRNNAFDHTGYALMGLYETADAAWNWWGDPSGPYNAAQNPGGLGDTVAGSVIFAPWYSDSTFSSASDRHPPLPEKMSLNIYPNPFNAVATLNFSTNRPGVFRMELFDLLGQRVKELWSGTVDSEKRLSFNGADLPSGLYFVRVWQAAGNRSAAMQKIVLLK